MKLKNFLIIIVAITTVASFTSCKKGPNSFSSTEIESTFEIALSMQKENQDIQQLQKP